LQLDQADISNQLRSYAMIYELDLDILKMYMHTKNEVRGQAFQKLWRKQYRQIDRLTNMTTTTLHSLVVISWQLLSPANVTVSTGLNTAVS